MLIYVEGDLFKNIHRGTGHVIIAHICNNRGKWGRGFVVALSKYSPLPEEEYRSLPYYELGMSQVVSINPAVSVVNMVAQSGFASPTNPVAVNYTALEACLGYLKNYALEKSASIHMPKIGSGLGGGDWNKIERLINIKLKGIPVIIYEL